jgi:hypothetical protein
MRYVSRQERDSEVPTGDPGVLFHKIRLNFRERFDTTPLAEILIAAHSVAFTRGMLDKVVVRLSPQVQTCECNLDTKEILLSPFLSYDEGLCYLVKMLRVLFRGTPKYQELDYDSLVIAHRIDLGDRFSCVVRFAWELKLLGDVTLWDRIEASSFKTEFKEQVQRDFRKLNNGWANSGLVAEWIMDDGIVRRADRTCIQQCLTGRWGKGRRRINLDDVLSLTKLPDLKYSRTTYLQNPQDFITLPEFTDVRDRSNSNFLWFLNFERAYTEVEPDGPL